MADNSDQLRQAFLDYYSNKISEPDRAELIRELVAGDSDSIERNRAANEGLLNYLQYDFEPGTLVDRVGAEEAVMTSSVPFGFEDKDYLSEGLVTTIAGTNMPPAEGDTQRRIFVTGKFDKTTPIHEGIHSLISGLNYSQEEEGVRALDVLRARRSGDPKMIRMAEKQYINYVDQPSIVKLLGEGRLEDAFNIVDRGFTSSDESNLQESALKIKGNLNDRFYNALTEEERITFKKDGGVAGYFERPEIDGMLYSSQFEKDVSEKPGYEYGMILPISTNVETGESQFDLAGGITGGIGRGLSTLDRSLSGISVADEELMEGLMNVVGPSAGVAGLAAGPGQLPGLIGAFNLKHGSGALFDKLRRSETGIAGPGVYGTDDIDTALGYARRNAFNRPVEYDNIAKQFEDIYLDPSEGVNAIGYAAENAVRKFIDTAANTTRFIFSDGSSMKINRALNDVDFSDMPQQLYDDLEYADIEFDGSGTGYIYDIALKETKDDFFDFNSNIYNQPSKHRKALLDLAEETGFLKRYGSDVNGRAFYRHLTDLYGSQDAASKKLSELGLIGNRVKIGLAGEPSDAYVIFDPDKIEIKGTEVADFADGGVAGLAPIAQNMFRN